MFDFLKLSKRKDAAAEAVACFNEDARAGSNKNQFLQRCWDEQLPVVVPGGAGGKAVVLPRTSDTFCM